MFLATTNAILELLSQSVLVLIFVIFLMIGGEGRRQAASGVWGEAEARVKRYLVAKAVISAATGTLVGLTLALLGVDLALVFGLFAFLLNFIPSIGSIIATLLPLPVVLLSPDLSTTAAVLAITVPGAIQIVVGSFVDPRVMGEALDLHPVVILIALIFWGMLWGIAGALLAVPITAVIKIALEKSEQARPITELMAGRLEALRSP
jgi:AI-2 transport protein TqsA